LLSLPRAASPPPISNITPPPPRFTSPPTPAAPLSPAARRPSLHRRPLSIRISRSHRRPLSIRSPSRRRRFPPPDRCRQRTLALTAFRHRIAHRPVSTAQPSGRRQSLVIRSHHSRGVVKPSGLPWRS
ncbi:Os04g0485601, partial [Oryza sativa Japonica Group]